MAGELPEPGDFPKSLFVNQNEQIPGTKSRVPTDVADNLLLHLNI